MKVGASDEMPTGRERESGSGSRVDGEGAVIDTRRLSAALAAEVPVDREQRRTVDGTSEKRSTENMLLRGSGWVEGGLGMGGGAG